MIKFKEENTKPIIRLSDITDENKLNALLRIQEGYEVFEYELRIKHPSYNLLMHEIDEIARRLYLKSI